MKRALPIVPLVLFILLNACVPTIIPGIVSPEIGTAVALTQTASVWTVTVTSTTSYYSSYGSIVDSLNAWLPEDNYLTKAQELEKTMGASYEVVDARTLPENNLPGRIFEVMVHCECAVATSCCSPERMFVLIMRKLEYYRDSVIWQVPDTVVELNVHCLDHGDRLGIMAARWADVEDYLYGRINSKQFGSRVWRK